MRVSFIATEDQLVQLFTNMINAAKKDTITGRGKFFEKKIYTVEEMKPKVLKWLGNQALSTLTTFCGRALFCQVYATPNLQINYGWNVSIDTGNNDPNIQTWLSEYPNIFTLIESVPGIQVR